MTLSPLDLTMPVTALRLITTYGQTVTFNQVTANAYNPATGTATTTSNSVTLKALIEDYPDRLKPEGVSLNGSIQQGDRKATVAAQSLSFVPVVGSTITVGTNTYIIVDVASQNSGELTATYIMQIRKR